LKLIYNQPKALCDLKKMMSPGTCWQYLNCQQVLL